MLKSSDRFVSPRHSPESTSIGDDSSVLSEMEASDRQAAAAAYNTILQMGGRPSRMPPSDLRPQTSIDMNTQVYPALHHPSDVGTQLREELERWRMFRKYQNDIRRDQYAFRQLQQRLQNYWHKEGLRHDLKPDLQFQAQNQTKLEEWKEFYFFQYQRSGWMEKKIEEAQKQKARAMKTVNLNEAEKLSFEMRVAAAKKDWESWNTWLQWVEGQLSTIAENLPLNYKALNNSHQVDPELTGLTPNVEPIRPRLSLRSGSGFSRKSSISKHSGRQHSPYTALHRNPPIEGSECLDNSDGQIPELSPPHHRFLRHRAQPSSSITVTREPTGPSKARRSRRQIEARRKLNSGGSSGMLRRGYQDNQGQDNSSPVLRRSIRIAQKKKIQSRCTQNETWNIA